MVGSFRSLLAAAAAVAAVCVRIAVADVITLPAAADNTIYGESASLSNGAGSHFFAGRTDSGETRRGLIRFDLSPIPPGSVINSVSLTLFVSRTRADTEAVSLHRLLASWGESTSQASGGEGAGGGAEPGDATWGFRFYDTESWATAGGDFAASSSATQMVGNQNRSYTWTSAQMVADVQAWLADASTNHGWIVVGNEAATRTAKRFDSRTNSTVSNRPRLVIDFTPPSGTGACCLPSGGCVVTTPENCAVQGGTFRGEGTSCTPDPCSTVVAVFTSDRDNTLYESATGALSNGAGTGFFTGIDMGLRRRGLVRFDVSSIPPGATIVDVRLRLYCGFSQGNMPDTFTVHRMHADWGEGTSVASGNQSGGAASTPGDATWIHSFHPSQFWMSPGGDYHAMASASLGIPASSGSYEWSSAALVADVQHWVMHGGNNGWLIRGTEGAGRNTRRFDTRESGTPSNRPQLVVTYSTSQGAFGACCLSDGTCIEATAADCASMGGTYLGDGTDCAHSSCPPPLTPFVDPLPLPGVAQPVTGQPGDEAHYRIAMKEVTQQLHRDLPATRVWGYGGSYPGPTIEARRGRRVTVDWVNDLRDVFTGQLRNRHHLAVDTCLHGPDQTGEVPVTVVHVHGAHTDSFSDGQPEDAFPPGQESGLHTYPNDQPAATIWYHDHALGITRLNVYMGLAGFYLIRDDAEDALNIPRGEFEVPLAIQDRSFRDDGSLIYPDRWVEHFFGDFILVNGKVWPYFEVKRGKYRFRVLNGSSSRAYTLALPGSAPFWQIGSDTGLLAAPVELTSLTLTPGERADIVVDFAPYAPGTELVLTNSAPSPFPNGGMGKDIANVMQFRVRAEAGHTDPLPPTLVPVARIPESEARMQRDLLLRKTPDHHCGYADMWTINDLGWNDITEFPRLGSTEVWAWINRSGVAHPMHMHLVSFQILDRQDFEVVGGEIVPVGPRVPPPPGEMGWKDTVRAMPGQITRVIARFESFIGPFPYHCHILEHEDHEMMRQFVVVCPGDFNLDGQVDFFDYLDFVLAYAADEPGADFNGDGQVDFFDYLDFVQAFSAECP